MLSLLDGDAHFQSVSGLAQMLGMAVNGTYVIQEMIVVAIPNTGRTPTHTETGFDAELNPHQPSPLGRRNGQALRSEFLPSSKWLPSSS